MPSLKLCRIPTFNQTIVYHAFCLYIFTILLLCLICREVPYSKFFHSPDSSFASDLAERLNERRVLESKHYFRSLSSGASNQFYQELVGPVDIVVSIVTVQRKSSSGGNPSYLIQSVAMFDQLIKSDLHFKNKSLIICNVDNQPENHSDAEFLKKYIPYVQRYGNSVRSSVEIPRLRVLYRNKRHSSNYDKEVYDYMFCLQAALEYQPKFVLLIEDDALPHRDLFTVLKYVMTIRFSSEGWKGNFGNFLYLKLYYPERWLGYANEPMRMLELVGIGSAGSGLFVFVACTLYKVFRKNDHIIISFLGAVYFITIALLIGRQNVMELRRIFSFLYMIHPASDCCTPAMLYPSSSIPLVLDHLAVSNCTRQHPMDIALAKFAQQSVLPSLQIEPNLFHHIGMYSSLGYIAKNPEEFLFL